MDGCVFERLGGAWRSTGRFGRGEEGESEEQRGSPLSPLSSSSSLPLTHAVLPHNRPARSHQPTTKTAPAPHTPSITRNTALLITPRPAFSAANRSRETRARKASSPCSKQGARRHGPAQGPVRRREVGQGAWTRTERRLCTPAPSLPTPHTARRRRRRRPTLTPPPPPARQTNNPHSSSTCPCAGQCTGPWPAPSSPQCCSVSFRSSSTETELLWRPATAALTPPRPAPRQQKTGGPCTRGAAIAYGAGFGTGSAWQSCSKDFEGFLPSRSGGGGGGGGGSGGGGAARS